MAPNPEIRASDADRDRVATSLREHCALGRITTEELQERIEAVYSAKTLGELEAVTHDLPEEDLHTLPVPASQRTPGSASVAARRGGGVAPRHDMRTAWAGWASVSAVCTTIWLITVVTGGGLQGFWPIWVAGPWGVLILVGFLFGRRRD
ncbi:DUF1707 SHOCT-like domain-containing protein [Actinomadura macrotermitis]|uniref:DUF1707 domain-containing protein n=1 Tax=Actinomadura macrotermitis TaxID=2585200 RepID=A0A7K0C2D9_9ACTN|nr:DUF1707 domain-containing protein [Actinomadura macrotermitis]MQY07595.1 hypothetical protein [Actinomadura macrotermitis]